MFKFKDFIVNHFYFLIPFVFLCISLIVNFNFDGHGDWNDFAEFATIGRYYFLEFQQLPLWDPYSQGGVDMTQQPEVHYFSPFFLLILIFGVPIGLKLTIICYLLIGYIGILKWLKTFDFKIAHVSIAASCYTFSAYFSAHLGEGHFTFLAMFYLPWILYIFRLKNTDNIFLLNFLLLIFLFTSGSPNFVIYAALLYIILGTYCFAKRKNKTFFIVLVSSSILAILSTSFILVPIIVGTEDINRSLLIENNSILTILKSLLYPLNRDYIWGPWGAHEYQSTMPYILIPLFISVALKLKSNFLKSYPIYYFIMFIGIMLSLGGDHFYSLYYWFKQIPIASNLRVASRFLIYFVLLIPFITAYSLDHFSRNRTYFKLGPLTINAIHLIWLCCLPHFLHNIYYLDQRWIKSKDISSLNALGNGQYSTFTYEFATDINAKEIFFKPNIGLINTLRSQTELKKRKFHSKQFLIKGDGKILQWTPNYFLLSIRKVEEFHINMYCNHFWTADAGQLECKNDHLVLKPNKTGDVKIYYDSENYLNFLKISFVFFVLSLLIGLNIKKNGVKFKNLNIYFL